MQLAGWIKDDNSNVRLVISISEGEPAESSPNEQSSAGNPNHRAKTIAVTPIISNIEVRDDDDTVVWGLKDMTARLYSTPAMDMPVEKMRSQVRMSFMGFFSGLVLPTRIPQPPYAFGFGESQLDDSVWVENK